MRVNGPGESASAHYRLTRLIENPSNSHDFPKTPAHERLQINPQTLTKDWCVEEAAMKMSAQRENTVSSQERPAKLLERGAKRKCQRVALVLASLVGLVAPSAAANDQCGATIIANLELDHDLTCPGDGLIVGTDGITIDLNGHTIAGSGNGVGISVNGRSNVSILGGTLRNFEAGVRITDSTSIVVKQNQFLENRDGVDLQRGSRRNTIKENEFWDNRARGIMLRGGSADNVIKENTFTGNRVGILVFGGVDSTVQENIVSASGLAGIRLIIGTGNLIVENTVVSNPAGIDFVVTVTGTAVGNTFVENTIAMNTCGLTGPFAGNTFTENLFQGNGADTCP